MQRFFEKKNDQNNKMKRIEKTLFISAKNGRPYIIARKYEMQCIDANLNVASFSKIF